jgi:alkylated DNA repair dioxygenase AlkB
MKGGSTMPSRHILYYSNHQESILMDRQNALFPEIEERPTQPELSGFRYREEIVTKEEKASLVTSLGQLDLKPFEFHGHLGSRRVLSFGLRYDYSRSSVEQASEMPGFLDDLLVRVGKFSGYEVDAFRQVGVNEYRPGAGIGWHKDKPQFGIVVGVSLLAPATMRFRRAHGTSRKRITYTVKPRSIYILSGEARTVWEHSIPPLTELRYSITFRTLSQTFRAPADQS